METKTAAVAASMGAALAIVLAGVMSAGTTRYASPLRQAVEIALASDADPELQYVAPAFARCPNWGSSGSCVYAATVSVLAWQGQQDLSRIVRENFSGGAWYYEVAAILTRAKQKYAGTLTGDMNFLRWATASRRFCVVGCWIGGPMFPCDLPKGTDRRQVAGHSVTVVMVDASFVTIYDSNHPSTAMRRVPLKDFLSDWQGWAITPISYPLPPSPFHYEKQRG